MGTSSRYVALAMSAIAWVSSAAMGNHPNEGDQTLESLSSMAISNSLELKALDQKIQSFQMRERAAYGAFAPSLSIEAGPQYSNVSGQTNSGTALYGKADWNLYRGGQDQIDAEIADENAAGLTRQRAALENRVRAEVAEAYYEAQFAVESVALKKEALALNSEQKKSALSKNKAGFTAKSDVLEFELRETTIMSDILLAEQKVREGERKLQSLIGKSGSESMPRVKGHLERRPPPELSRASLVESLLLKNENLQRAQTARANMVLETRKARASYYPKVDFETRYGRLGNAERVNPDNNSVTMLLKVSMPIFSGLETTHRKRSLEAIVRANEFDIDLEKTHLLEDLDILISTVEAIQKRLDVEEENLQRSRSYYDATLQEYRRGLKNSPDMVTASERVLEAKLRNLEFRRDLSVAIAKISKLTGMAIK